MRGRWGRHPFGSGSSQDSSGIPKRSFRRIERRRPAFRSPYRSLATVAESSTSWREVSACDHPSFSRAAQRRGMAAEVALPRLFRRLSSPIMPLNLADDCQAVKRQRRADVRATLPFVSMAKAKSEIHPGTPLGERLLDAILAEGRSVNSTEDALEMSRGHLGRIIRGERWKDTVDVELAAKIAKLLHVTPEWLVWGTGHRRRGGRPETKAEVAFKFCRECGAREDAIQLAWEENKDREARMEIMDWVNAINACTVKLAGTPRPEETVEKKRATRRLKARLERAKELEREPSDPPKPAVVPLARIK